MLRSLTCKVRLSRNLVVHVRPTLYVQRMPASGGGVMDGGLQCDSRAETIGTASL